ncbi:MAG TPA: glycosyltransferase family 39 protein [Pseudolabrys sp.]|nr:glycosyltransferase family 39 protein [Pseudolabrys sp.]
MTSTTDHARQGIARAKGLAAVLDYACASHRRAALILVALAALSFLPGFFQIPPVDRDEARFAQATKQMVESGNYVDIRFQNEVRYKKPVGIYWLQAVVLKTADALGVPKAHTTIWLYRIPSLLGAIGAVLLTYWCALAFVTRRAALLAGMMMASSILLGVEARLAKTDAVLLLTIVAAMGAMARIYLAGRRTPASPTGWALPAVFWTALAAGILIKGPVIVMVAGLAAATLAICDRSARWMKALRPLPGVLWMLVLALPWFVAILAHSGGSFFAQSVGHDMLGKVMRGQEAHGAPPGYYFLLFWVTFWPGAVLAGLAAPAIWRARREPATQFLLAWLVPSWIVFEAVMTKLPHYVLPLYPAIAILVAGVLDRGDLTKGHWLTKGTVGWFLFPAAMAIGVVVLSVALAGDLGIPAWPFAAAALIFGLFAWRLYEVDGAERSLLRGIAASVLVAFAAYGLIFPSLPALFPAALLAEQLADTDCPKPQVASAGYEEPSLVFLLGTDTRFADGAGAAEFLRQKPCRFAFIDAHNERSFVQRADATALRYARVGIVDGFNVSSGRKVSISIFRSAGR